MQSKQSVPIISGAVGPSAAPRYDRSAAPSYRTFQSSVHAEQRSIFAPKKTKDKPSIAESEKAVCQLLDKYDFNRDGFLDEREIRGLLKEMFHLGVASTELNDEGVHLLMDAIDQDRSGMVSTAELLGAWRTWLGRALFPVRCLLVIDVQNDFISGTLAVKAAEQVVPVINQMRKDLHFDVVAVSKDWHPHTHCSFHESFVDNPPGSRPSELHASLSQEKRDVSEGSAMFSEVTLTAPNGQPMGQVLWPRHCVQDSWGSRMHEDLHVQSTDLIVCKGTNPMIDSYSAFHDNMKLQPTGLSDQLRKRRVSHVYVVGIALDYCVCFTALHAAEDGLVVTVVLDACRAVATDSEEKARMMFAAAGVRMCTSAELPTLMKADALHEALMSARSITAATKVAHSTMDMPKMGVPGR